MNAILAIGHSSGTLGPSAISFLPMVFSHPLCHPRVDSMLITPAVRDGFISLPLYSLVQWLVCLAYEAIVRGSLLTEVGGLFSVRQKPQMRLPPSDGK